MRSIRIGNGAGFWGDSLAAPRRLAEAASLDYLTLEYLAELTMSILAHQLARDPAAGYVADFPVVLEDLVPALRAQPGLRIVTNAGGMNPAGCVQRVSETLTAAGLDDARVAAVDGDDLLPALDEHLAQGERFANLDTGEPLESVRGQVVCANAYLGAGGIVEALAGGARVVVTGRVADAALPLAPAVFEFGWPWDDWDRLAAASVAGHLIECGAQVTGGMHSEWDGTVRLGDVGYPVAELSADGAAVITKPPGTGGRVTVGTLAEQLVYEIGDPAHYLTPDVDADFTGVRLDADGADRVRVTGARGRGRPDRLKVSLAYRDGWAVAAMLVVVGPDAVPRARQCAEIVFERVRAAGFTLGRTNVECLGAGDSVPGVLAAAVDPPEVVLRISAHDASREALERLVREMAPLVTSGPPGVTGYTGARPKPHPVLAYWPTTIGRTRVRPRVRLGTARDWLEHGEQHAIVSTDP
ncbi:MAG TPA: acyclic terpene utilization AtuA family protein [Planctomycetaceae bacterium]|nr:acyclic terpene utilization AtuA family protein [Planctomycetaceae bacterium]